MITHMCLARTIMSFPLSSHFVTSLSNICFSLRKLSACCLIFCCSSSGSFSKACCISEKNQIGKINLLEKLSLSLLIWYTHKIYGEAYPALHSFIWHVLTARDSANCDKKEFVAIFSFDKDMLDKLHKQVSILLLPVSVLLSSITTSSGSSSSSSYTTLR